MSKIDPAGFGEAIDWAIKEAKTLSSKPAEVLALPWRDGIPPGGRS
jgi:hypothetical protein